MQLLSPLGRREQTLRYSVYTVQVNTEDGTGGAFSRSFIVLKNGYGVITRFTRFHEYAGIYAGKTFRPLASNAQARLYFICKMLNYVLVDHGVEFGIRHVFQITKPMLATFFGGYAMEQQKDGSFRGKDSVERCTRTVTGFMNSLCSRFGEYMVLSKGELYKEVAVVTRKGQLTRRMVPAFQTVGIPKTDGLFRDIPTKVLEILLPMAFRYAPNIAFGLCLQAFAGLRGGEVCNVRQEYSPLGRGLRIVEVGGQIVKVELDLRRELVLRSDGVSTGRIKKERQQCVYPAFLSAFMRAYELHKEYLRHVRCEEAYMPMFVNQKGLALSYESYRQQFKKLINEHLRPSLVENGDPELHLYGQMLCENQLGTHALRHWYTVQLVLRNEDVGGVQYWRGDSSPESAFLYLQNKGDLVHEFKETSEKLLDTLLHVGGEHLGE